MPMQIFRNDNSWKIRGEFLFASPALWTLFLSFWVYYYFRNAQVIQ